MLDKYSITELEPHSWPQMNFYCLKKKRTRSSKLKYPQDFALFRARVANLVGFRLSQVCTLKLQE